MSREIKFRICHDWNSHKSIIYPDKLRNNYMIGIDGTIYENYGTEDKPLWENVFDATVFLQQYTGLKDKNGVEIYEGDMIIFDNSDIGGEVYNGIIEWNTDQTLGGIGLGLWIPSISFNGHSYQKAGWLVTDFLGSIEVVGNIFEGVDK